MTMALKKALDKVPKSVYNIRRKDGEGFDLSSIPNKFNRAAVEPYFQQTLFNSYSLIKQAYEDDPSLFVAPPVFAGGFLRDILWAKWPNDLDLFVNSHGLDPTEAEDNLCLFLSKLGVRYQEHCPAFDNAQYARMKIESKADWSTVFRVFNLIDNEIHLPLGEERTIMCHTQIILKDLGPPQDDPLYVTNDFHYNHGKAALSVAGEPEIHYHGHAMGGFTHNVHLQYREGGFTKCDEMERSFTYEQRLKVQRLDLTKPITPESLLDSVKRKTEERNQQLKEFLGSDRNKSSVPLWYIK